MYRVKSAIQSGQTFTVGTNIEATTIGGEIQRINNDLSVTKIKTTSVTVTGPTLSANTPVTYTVNIPANVQSQITTICGVTVVHSQAPHFICNIMSVAKTGIQVGMRNVWSGDLATDITVILAYV
jgi:hypothetical protein